MEQSALEKLYHQYFNKTYRTAYLVTGDHQMAEDAAQEAFFKAFSNLDALRDLNKFGSWVNVIASNYAIDMLRKKKKMIFTDNFAVHADRNPGNSPQDAWEKNEEAQEIRDALLLLEPEEREILVLKYFNELSINEISAIVNVPQGTIKSRLFRARKKVRKLLQPKKQ
ncbi:MAG: RNA polymerase sigma factor [Firmicutes bacterium]|jgi:RNA polymerase sigma-70 factor (ECF subfamily)|nr:RNA polymerase sigma factor [Bacillota bacterium]